MQDAEYLYALEKKSSPKSEALQEQARSFATHFTKGWNPGCSPKGSGIHANGANWGDDGEYLFLVRISDICCVDIQHLCSSIFHNSRQSHRRLHWTQLKF